MDTNEALELIRAVLREDIEVDHPIVLDTRLALPPFELDSLDHLVLVSGLADRTGREVDLSLDVTLAELTIEQIVARLMTTDG